MSDVRDPTAVGPGRLADKVDIATLDSDRESAEPPGCASVVGACNAYAMEFGLGIGASQGSSQESPPSSQGPIKLEFYGVSGSQCSPGATYSLADLVDVVRADIASTRNTTPGRVVLLANQAELLDGFKLGASLGPCDETQCICVTVMEMPCEVTPASYGDFVDTNTTGFMKVREIRFPLYHRMWRDDAGKWHPRTDAESFENSVGVADFPPSRNICINMMPFVLEDCNSIPAKYRHYWPMIQECKAKSAPGQLAFLTIHESDVEAGEVQRRPGLHVEAPRVLSESGEWMNRRAHWGCGLVRGDMSYVEGGMYMATNTPDSSRIWNAKILDTARAARLDGSVEHLREHLGEGEVMEANTLYWLTDATPHEALPLPVASHRQFFRLVTGPLGTWFSQHNTKNPLVPASKLSPATKVVSTNKFETPSSARPDSASSE